MPYGLQIIFLWYNTSIKGNRPQAWLASMLIK